MNKTKEDLEEEITWLKATLKYERFEHNLTKIGMVLFLLLSICLAILGRLS